MVDEIKVSISKISYARDNLTVYDLSSGVEGFSLDASDSQRNSSAYAGYTKALAKITNTHTAGVNLSIWSTVGTVAEANSTYIEAGETLVSYINTSDVVSVKVL